MLKIMMRYRIFKINFPFKIIGRPEVYGVLWADNDNFQAMYLLTQKLIEII